MIRRQKPIVRSPLRRSRKRIPFRSQRSTDRLDERAAIVDAAWRRDAGRCQADSRIPQAFPRVRCSGPLDPHEIIPRSVWAGGQYVLANVVMVCRAHHDWIGDHPAVAHRIGLHGYSHERLRIIEGGS